MKLVACLILIASLSLGFGGLTTADVITRLERKGGDRGC